MIKSENVGSPLLSAASNHMITNLCNKLMDNYNDEGGNKLVYVEADLTKTLSLSAPLGGFCVCECLCMCVCRAWVYMCA